MKYKHYLVLTSITLLLTCQVAPANEPGRVAPATDGETRFALFLVEYFHESYDRLDEKTKIEADERIYQMMFTHYVSVTLLNEENNQFIQDRLRGILERVRQSNSFIKTTDKPRRFFSDEGKFRSDKFVCRMSDGSLKELEIATREEFDKLNDGFKAFLAKLSTP